VAQVVANNSKFAFPKCPKSHDVRNLVRQQRVIRNMTQQELAERVGVTRQTILSIEKGKYTPSALALCIAGIFGVSVESLFAENGHKKTAAVNCGRSANRPQT